MKFIVINYFNFNILGNDGEMDVEEGLSRYSGGHIRSCCDFCKLTFRLAEEVSICP